MTATDRYSRLVSAMKVVLPLAALAILATLFLVAETFDPEAAIPYADVDVDQLVEEQGITRPSFGGQTVDGTTVTLIAETIRPDEDDFIGQALSARLQLPDAATITIESPEGRVDADRTVTLSGGAHIESTTGWSIDTERLTTSLDSATAETAGAVEATGPAGKLSAGRMLLKNNGGYRLLFTDGVRLIYQPER